MADATSGVTAASRTSGADGADREPSDEANTPTRVSIAVVFLASVVSAVVLMTRVGPALSVAVAFVDAALFAASLWLVGRDRWRALATTVAGVLALIVGVGFVGSVGYATLALVGTLYPVETVDQIRPAGLRVVSATVVVFGGTVAMIGGLTVVDDLLDHDSVWKHAKLAVKTFVVPLLVATLMLLSTLLARSDAAVQVPLVEGVVGYAGGALGALVVPVPGRTHLLTFCLLLSTTALAAGRAVDALPLSELSVTRRSARIESTAATIRSSARRTAIVAALVLPVTLVEVVVPPANLRTLVPAPVYDALAAVTASTVVRVPILVVALLSLGTLVTVGLLRQLVQTDARTAVLELPPFLGGGAIVALVVAIHGVVLSPALDFVGTRLPGEFASSFTRQSTAVVEFYGSLPVVMSAAAMLVGVTALLSLVLALVTTTGLLSERATAPALAATGTFLSAAFAAGAGVAAPFVLGGLVASLLAWDAGEFGATMGREIGRAGTTNRPEFVHVAATLAVGAVSALAAFLVYTVVTGSVFVDLTVVPFALAVVVVALLSLVAALR